MTYNIHHANPPSEKVKIDLVAIARVINQQKPDLVALQEVDVYTERSGKNLDQARELARLTGMKSFFMKALDYQGGEYGIAVLSRYTIVDSVGYLLPRDPAIGGEDRAVAAITVQLPGQKRVIFASTHLDLKEENRLSQAKALITHFKDSSLPMILGGDFNALSGSPVMDLFDQHFTRTCRDDCAPTIPVNSPNRTIDFIMYNPINSFKILNTRVIDEKYASDHLPVVAELEIL
ncbi:endonuclease/exonuclease/phosphatase family protein [Persicitalea sp.]|uniref:endonuclease/exonuclease/phosphatase family protein n=1 Tax=Persicitalea sp. TaxID=3100273 RepID=UPI0035945C9A